MEEGLFGVNGISAHAFANYVDADGECIRCTATRAKNMVRRELQAAQFMVVVTCAAKQQLLCSQLQAGQAQHPIATQPNTGGLFRHSDSGLSPGGCDGLGDATNWNTGGPRNHGDSEFARAMPSLFHVFTVVDYEPVGNDVITNLLRK
eukprot:scaffold33525_cov188-Skeletonema_dohrnii-CCMP3373.AAC.1